MKLIFNIFKKTSIAVVCLGFLISCDEFLDREPITQETFAPEALMTTAAQAEEAMATIYSNFGSEYWQFDYFVNGDGQSDVSYAGADNPANFELDEYRIKATNGNISRDWGYLYKQINACNLLLGNINNATDLNPTRKEEMIGEASIVRAMCYFQVVQLWGDAPLVTQFVANIDNDNIDEIYPQLYPIRTEMTIIYDTIINDLEKAIQGAPSVASDKSIASKEAAHALASKVFATKPNPDWGKVVEHADAAINGGFTLLATYDHLFDNQHAYNDESIWERNADGNTIWNWGVQMFCKEGWDFKKFNLPSNDMIKTFEDENDQVRHEASIVYHAITSYSDPNYSASQYPFINKQRYATTNDQNYYLFRLADILLIKAEALARQGNYTEAMTYVNQVRTRAGLSDATAASADEAIDVILNERKLELCYEGHRWFDLKRMGKAMEILANQKDGNGNVMSYASNLTQERLLWPVPQSERDKNEKLTQNPGY